MQRSGEKAAAMVQDLLTLTRRQAKDFEAGENPKISAGNSTNRPNKTFNRRNPGLVRKQTLPFPSTLDEAELETPTYLRQAAD